MDDDISISVQDIDSRKLSSGRVKEGEKRERDRERAMERGRDRDRDREGSTSDRNDREMGQEGGRGRGGQVREIVTTSSVNRLRRPTTVLTALGNTAVTTSTSPPAASTSPNRGTRYEPRTCGEVETDE